MTDASADFINTLEDFVAHLRYEIPDTARNELAEAGLPPFPEWFDGFLHGVGAPQRSELEGSMAAGAIRFTARDLEDPLFRCRTLARVATGDYCPPRGPIKVRGCYIHLLHPYHRYL